MHTHPITQHIAQCSTAQHRCLHNHIAPCHIALAPYACEIEAMAVRGAGRDAFNLNLMPPETTSITCQGSQSAAGDGGGAIARQMFLFRKPADLFNAVGRPRASASTLSIRLTVTLGSVGFI